MKIKALVVFLLITTLFYTGCNIKASKNSKTAPTISKTIVTVPENKNTEILITAVGDILVHQTQLDSQYISASKTYDFTNNFKFIKPYIQRSDLSLVNLETSLGGDKKPYSGYPTFSTPDSILDALKDTGFKVISAANNHTMDSGGAGLLRTAEVVKSKGLTLLGLRSKDTDPDYMIQNIKGVNIGMTSYTFETAPLMAIKQLIQ